jgi:redox-sensitive bicupin YhaK (pirin superfamily)
MSETTDIERILPARDRDLGGIVVGRVLPTVGRHFLGPYVLLDHMQSAHGLAVRPHPHMHLATVTYLFAGEITHRDSLGSVQRIVPGDINWMSAGTGIVHSERTATGPLHGLQIWVGLPRAAEDTPPFFEHTPAAALPVVETDGARLRVLAGAAFGLTAPVRTASPLFYVDVEATAPGGARVGIPGGYAERAVYVIEGGVAVGGRAVPPRQLAVIAPGATPVIEAERGARAVLLGGDPLDGPRYIWWNFVSSSKDRIEAAAQAWRAGGFPRIRDDDAEFIPAPDGPHFASGA